MDSPDRTGLSWPGGLLQSCPARCVPQLSCSYFASRLTRGCRGTRPANLESGARATLFQLPGFTSSQRQLGGRGDALAGSPRGD